MSVLYYTVKAQGKTVYSAKYKQDAQLLSPAPSGAHSPRVSTHLTSSAVINNQMELCLHNVEER